MWHFFGYIENYVNGQAYLKLFDYGQLLYTFIFLLYSTLGSQQPKL